MNNAYCFNRLSSQHRFNSYFLIVSCTGNSCSHKHRVWRSYAVAVFPNSLKLRGQGSLWAEDAQASCGGGESPELETPALGRVSYPVGGVICLCDAGKHRHCSCDVPERISKVLRGNSQELHLLLCPLGALFVLGTSQGNGNIVNCNIP